MNEMNHNNELAIAYAPVEGLKANARNARTHSRRQIAAIADSIKASGFNVPVLVDENGVILAGHGRIAAAKMLGLARVPTVRIETLSEAQKRAFVIADNKLAEGAGWDRSMLALELGDLSVLLPQEGFSVELTGFEVPEIDLMLADVEEEKAASRDDEPVSAPATPVSRAGDVWTLGRHRIICGDARDPFVLQTLLAGEEVDAAFFDPPYNVRVQGHVSGNGRIQHPEFAMGSGEMTPAEFAEFLRVNLTNAVSVSRNGAVHFIAMDWRHIADLINVGGGVYGALLNLCVWTKSNAGMGSLYRSQHELIAVFKVGDAAHQNNVELGRHGRNRSNVWRYAGANAFSASRDSDLAMHPTVKPVALVADAIKDVTRRNAVVLDLFGGSGTTLIAAERTGRRARLVEIEPRYVDTTIARFESLTRMDAIHACGATYTELTAQRRAAH